MEQVQNCFEYTTL